jgi:hypothetical protein
MMLHVLCLSQGNKENHKLGVVNKCVSLQSRESNSSQKLRQVLKLQMRWVLRYFNRSLILESLEIPKYVIACKLRVLGFNL